MPELLAFLSYTRMDDEFFGGYITAFRKVLENAVHVVTGEKTFRIFQDIEGIVIGESWRKKLAEIINKSSFLVPMMSPLFFNSEPCRDEVKQFLEHERAIGKHDLILPVYFISSAKLEKEEEKTKDPLAKELAARQKSDWREMANVPLGEPAARKAILKLGGEIAKAIERLEGLGIRSRGEVKQPHPKRDYEALIGDLQLGDGVTGNLKREQAHPRRILWVDDIPDNNIWERRALESYGVRFVLARDTSEAEQLLIKKGPFVAIVSDVARPGDRQAGYTFLDRVRKAGINTPYFIYTGHVAAELWPMARARGAQGITADPDALVQMVVATFK
jgi:CheY-like chemotaxis protein